MKWLILISLFGLVFSENQCPTVTVTETETVTEFLGATQVASDLTACDPSKV